MYQLNENLFRILWSSFLSKLIDLFFKKRITSPIHTIIELVQTLKVEQIQNYLFMHNSSILSFFL